MKTMRIALLLVSLTVAANLFAQSIEVVVVEKQAVFQQTSAGAPTAAATNPFQFHFDVNGSNLSGFGTTRINTTAAGSGISGPISANYSAGGGGGEERWSATVANYSTQGAMDADYANGVYNVSVNGSSFNITLGSGSGPYASAFPAAAPMLTGLSAGDFDGSGNLKINTSLSSYTFTLNGLPGYTSGGHVGIFLDGVSDPGFVNGNNPSGEIEAQSIYLGGQTDAEVTFLTFNPSASSMVAGQTYTLELEYNLAPNGGSNGAGFGELDVGLFTYRTTLTIMAVPEPSTYAAILGLVALTGVMLHRRRQQLMA